MKKTWTNKAMLAGLSATVISFLFIFLAKIGASPELVLLPLSIGVLTFVLVWLKNPDLWELRAAQLAFTSLILTRGAYHVELNLENILPIPEAISKVLVTLGGDNAVTVALTLLTIFFTVYFRINHRVNTKIFVLMIDCLSCEELCNLRREIARKANMKLEDIKFGELEKGSIRIPVTTSFKNMRRIEKAFYSKNLTHTGQFYEGEEIKIVDIVDPSQERFFKTPLGNWFNHGFFETPEHPKLDWAETPADIRSYLNRCFAIICSTLSIYMLHIERRKLSYIGTWGGHDSILYIILFPMFFSIALPGILFFTSNSTRILIPLVIVFMSSYLIIFFYYFGIILLPSSHEAYSLAMMASLEARLLLEKKTSNSVSLDRIELMEGRVSQLGEWTAYEDEFRRTWSVIARELTRVLQARLTNAPWERLLSKPAYERFDLAVEGELQVE